jgi:hypothetical protein
MEKKTRYAKVITIEWVEDRKIDIDNPRSTSC